jgi:hypothetical protein
MRKIWAAGAAVAVLAALTGNVAQRPAAAEWLRAGTALPFVRPLDIEVIDDGFSYVVGDDHAFYSNDIDDTGTVAKVSRDGSVVASVALEHPTAVAMLGGSLFVLDQESAPPASRETPAIVEIDPVTMEILDRDPLGVAWPNWRLVAGGDRLWLVGIVAPASTVVAAFDPASDTTTTYTDLGLYGPALESVPGRPDLLVAWDAGSSSCEVEVVDVSVGAPVVLQSSNQMCGRVEVDVTGTTVLLSSWGQGTTAWSIDTLEQDAGGTTGPAWVSSADHVAGSAAAAGVVAVNEYDSYWGTEFVGLYAYGSTEPYHTFEGFTTTPLLAFNDDASLLVVVEPGSRDFGRPATVRMLATGARGVFTPVSPQRIVDTRTGVACNPTPGRLDPGRWIRIAGCAGVPAHATAVVLNVTVTGPTAPGWITVGDRSASTSNLNYAAGETVANQVVVPFDDTSRFIDPPPPGSVYVAASAPAHLVVDVSGYYVDRAVQDAQRLYAVNPTRVFDSRNTGSAVGPGQTIAVPITGGVVPAGAAAVVLNLTAILPTAPTYLTVWPASSPRPLASSINPGAGDVRANLVTVALPTSGVVNVYNDAGFVHFAADVVGWFGDGGSSPEGEFQPIAPVRLLDTRFDIGVPLGPDEVAVLQVGGVGNVPPAGVGAVVMNVTVTEPTHRGHSWLTVFPGDAPEIPLASSLNFSRGETVPNLVVVPVGADGTVAFHNPHGTTHLIVDVMGWYAA